MSDWIESDPSVMMGKPVVKGTRITVELILESLAAGESVDDLLAAHPRLTRPAVSAALAEIESWPYDDRTMFLLELSDRFVEQGLTVELAPETMNELKSRIDDLDRDPASAVPWEIAKERVLKRIRN